MPSQRATFLDYAKHAITERLGLEMRITDEQIAEFYEENKIPVSQKSVASHSPSHCPNRMTA